VVSATSSEGFLITAFWSYEVVEGLWESVFWSRIQLSHHNVKRNGVTSSLCRVNNAKWLPTVSVMHFYFVPGMDAKYCDERVCLSVCLSARTSQNRTSELYEIFCRPNLTCYSRPRLGPPLTNMLCTSGFVDDVMFSHSGPYGVWRWQ